MPKLTESKKLIPFKEVKDPVTVTSHPTNGPVLALFDSLRKRGVGPERAAFAVSQIYSKHDAGHFPKNQN